MAPYSLEEFLALANDKARQRIFDSCNYASFCDAIEQAGKFLNLGLPYYREYTAGGWSYRNGATTAAWGVWTEKNHVNTAVKRLTVRGRLVPPVRTGGYEQYIADFRKGFGENEV